MLKNLLVIFEAAQSKYLFNAQTFQYVAEHVAGLRTGTHT